MPEPYRVEAELLGPTPRRIVRAQGRPAAMAGMGCLRLFLIPFVVVGIGALLMAIGGSMVAAGGVDMPGKVVARRDTSDSDGSSYKVDFTYRRGDVVYSGSSNVSSDEYNRLEVGSDVTVEALPWAPSILPVIRDSSARGVGHFAFFWIFALFWNAVLSAFLWVAYVLPVIERRLVVDGLTAPGRVTKKTTDTSDDSTSYHVHYEFVAQAAADALIDSKYSVTKEQWESVAVGDTLTVLYNPRRPRRNLLYRFTQYQALG